MRRIGFLGLIAVLVGCQARKRDAQVTRDILAVYGQIHDILDDVENTADAEAVLPQFNEALVRLASINLPGKFDLELPAPDRGVSSKGHYRAYSFQIDRLISDLKPGPREVLRVAIRTYKQQAEITGATHREWFWTNGLAAALCLFVFFLVSLSSGRYSQGYLLAFLTVGMPFVFMSVAGLVWLIYESDERGLHAWVLPAVLVVAIAAVTHYLHEYFIRRFPAKAGLDDTDATEGRAGSGSEDDGSESGE